DVDALAREELDGFLRARGCVGAPALGAEDLDDRLAHEGLVGGDEDARGSVAHAGLRSAREPPRASSRAAPRSETEAAAGSRIVNPAPPASRFRAERFPPCARTMP